MALYYVQGESALELCVCLCRLDCRATWRVVYRFAVGQTLAFDGANRPRAAGCIVCFRVFQRYSNSFRLFARCLREMLWKVPIAPRLIRLNTESTVFE